MGPLEGVKVIELAQFLAGPFAGLLLADMGAEVIKVEAPSGDPVRHTDPLLNGHGALFLSVNRNKRSIAVNLKDPAGQAIVRKLASTADVFLQNLRPGDVERFGLAYSNLSALNPRLVYCSISGYGPKGPLADQPALEFALQAFTGLMSVTGEADRAPVRVGGSVVDVPAGMYGAMAVSFALNQRQRTGKGALVETSLFEATMSELVMLSAVYRATDEAPRRWGSANPVMVPYQAFQTRDGDISVGAGTDPQFKSLCQVMHLERLAEDPRYATLSARLVNRDSLVTELNEAFRTRNTAEWLVDLQAIGAICAPINSIPECLAHPQSEAVDLVVEVPHPGGGTFQALHTPIRVDGERVARRGAPPALGQHTDDVLRELGFGDEEIAGLRAAKTVS